MTQNHLFVLTNALGAVYMGGGTGCLPGRDVKRDLAMHVYISYLSRSVYMERILPGRFSSRPGKAGSRFAQPGSRQKRDNFYHINAPCPALRGRYYADFANCPG